jgi:hypothetical protein
MSPPQYVMLHDSKSAVPPQTMAPAPISDLILHAEWVTPGPNKQTRQYCWRQSQHNKTGVGAGLRPPLRHLSEDNHSLRRQGGLGGLRAVCYSRFALGDVDASNPQVMVVALASIVYTSARLRQETSLVPRRISYLACARKYASKRRGNDCRSRYHYPSIHPSIHPSRMHDKSIKAGIVQAWTRGFLIFFEDMRKTDSLNPKPSGHAKD